MSELIPCPFCGVVPSSKAVQSGMMMHSPTIDCPLAGIEMSVSKWNRRATRTEGETFDEWWERFSGGSGAPKSMAHTGWNAAVEYAARAEGLQPFEEMHKRCRQPNSPPYAPRYCVGYKEGSRDMHRACVAALTSAPSGEKEIIKCPECGGDGADHEDSSKDCFECHGDGVVEREEKKDKPGAWLPSQQRR